MKFTVTHDSIKALYNIQLDIDIDGLGVHVRRAFTEEILVDGGNEFLQWQANDMMKEAMSIASEAYMPAAMNQIKKGIGKAEWGKPPAKPDGISVKYGDIITTVDDPDELMWNPGDSRYVTNILDKYIDLEQRVTLPLHALEDMDESEDRHPFYTDITLSKAIIHLNDDANWTYDQIADWLETLDVDIVLNLEGGE